MRNGLKLGLTCGSALSLVFALSAVSPAFAQDAAVTEATPTAEEPTANTEEEAAEVQEVVVVGSRIRRDTYNTPAPVTLITREETTLAGFGSTTEALQNSTAVTGGSSQINNAYGGYVTEGGPGANTISLRGLGAGRTLVLLNGRRVAPAGSRGSVGTADLNVLPSAMLERVEILRDGASSVYGSDAIGGVVNMVTRKNIDGVEVEGMYSLPTNGGGEQTRLSIVAGRSFLDDRLTLNGSLEFYDRQDLTLADRDWTRCNQDYLFNDDGTRADYIDPATGKPKCYPITTTGSNGVTINTIGTQTIGGRNRFRPNDAYTGGPLPGYEPVTLASRDTFERRMLNESLISPVRVYTGYLNGTYELRSLGDAELYFEVLANRRTSEQTGYRQLSLDYAYGSPLIPAELAFSNQGAPTNITNGQNLGVRAFIGFGNDISSQEVDFLKLSGGIRGDFILPEWRYDVNVAFSRSDAEYTFQAFLIDRLSQSLDVVSNGAGGFQCRDLSGGCVAAPALSSDVVAGILPQDWVNYVWRPVTGTTLYTETVVNAAIDGPLFELPAGKVQGVFGVEYRTAEIDDTPGVDSQNGNLLNFTSSAVTRGSDSVMEAYGEVEVPVLADLPFAQALTLNASARYTNYDSYGDDWTYKIGAVYQPHDWVTFRATYGTSFRAPALFEQFQGATSGFLSASGDPCSTDNIGPAGGIRAQNCASEGIPIEGFTPTSGIAVISAGGAAQGLEAETSKNFTAGVILKPELPEGWGDLALAVDYYNIEIDNGVSRVGAGALLQLCYDDPEFRAGGGYCRFIEPRAAGSNQLTVYDSYTNIATQAVEGIDYNLRYTRDVGPGSARLNLGVTQYLTQKSRLFSTDPWDDYNGTLTAPEFTANADITYVMDQWTFRYGVDWIAGQDSHAYLGIPDGRAASGYDFKAPDYWLQNASVQYRAEDWTATVGVRNLTDETPPWISVGAYNRVGNSPLYSGYDYVGRTVFVNVSKRF